MTNRSADIGASGVTSIMGGERYRPYPAYKDSGTEWLGEIPAHWEVKKVTRFFLVGSGTTPSTDNHQYYGGGIPWVTTSELRETIVTSTEKTITEKALRTYSALKVYPKGSVAVAMYGATIGRIGVLGVSAAVNQACCVFSEPSGMDAWFWFYWIQFRRSYLISLGYGGGQPNLSQELLKSIQVPTPSLPEQRAIAAFLDRETAKIDALVAKKERLIELLQEKRTALISDAVTKGLDPDVPLKDSGVEWLGEIPAHWEVMPVWALFELGRGRVISHEDIYDNPGSYPVYSSQTERDGVMGYIGTYDFQGAHLTWTTDGAKAGTVSCRDGKFNCTNVCGTLRPIRTNEVVISFIKDALNLATAWFVRHDINPKLMNNVMAGIRIQVPPIEEQRAIAAFLDCETEPINALIAKVQEVINRLKELRTALISAAVTGKINVREAAD